MSDRLYQLYDRAHTNFFHGILGIGVAAVVAAGYMGCTDTPRQPSRPAKIEQASTAPRPPGMEILLPITTIVRPGEHQYALARRAYATARESVVQNSGVGRALEDGYAVSDISCAIEGIRISERPDESEIRHRVEVGNKINAPLDHLSGVVPSRLADAISAARIGQSMDGAARVDQRDFLMPDQPYVLGECNIKLTYQR